VRALQAEQIPWAEVHYSDNQPCIDMIEVPASPRHICAGTDHICAGTARACSGRAGPWRDYRRTLR
jgi:hypothetical protein